MFGSLNPSLSWRLSVVSALLLGLCISLTGSARGTPSDSSAPVAPTSPPAQRRVVSLAPSLTEWVYTLDAHAQLVARSARCDLPPQALKKPSAGGLFPPDLELILFFQPSDVLMIEGHEVLKAQLTRLGVRVHTLQPHSVDELWELVESLGALLERGEEARAWLTAARLRVTEELAQPVLRRPPLKVLIEVWPKPLSVAGAESFMGGLVSLAGGVLVPSGLGSWPQLPLETLLGLNPDVIFVSSPQRVRELLSPDAPRAWRAISAIQNKSVFAREGRLERPGPRVIDEVVWLKRRLDEASRLKDR